MKFSHAKYKLENAIEVVCSGIKSLHTKTKQHSNQLYFVKMQNIVWLCSLSLNERLRLWIEVKIRNDAEASNVEMLKQSSHTFLCSWEILSIVHLVFLWIEVRTAYIALKLLLVVHSFLCFRSYLLLSPAYNNFHLSNEISRNETVWIFCL